MAVTSKKKFKVRFSAKNKITSITKLPFLKLIYVSIVINLITITGILLFKKVIPPEVPLFYGLPEGDNQVVASQELIIPSMVSLLVVLVNISLSSLLQNEYLKRTLIIVSLIITLLSLITTLEIVFLVGSF